VKTLGVGLIGCGGMGRSLARQLRELENARIVAVTDVDAGACRDAAQEFAAAGCETAEAVVADKAVEAVLIASPGIYHRPLAELASAHGKHLFVEKPLATNVEDCDAIIEAARRANVTLMVGQVLRYYPCWGHILQMVREGAIGEPIAISVTRIGDNWEGWKQPWRNSRAMSGGMLMEINAHEIDFICEIGGDVERVYAEADHFGPDPADYPNLGFVSLRFRNRSRGMLHTSTVAAMSDQSGRIQGTRGTIVYADGFSPTGQIRYAPRGGEIETIMVTSLQVEQPVRRELRLFVESVLTGTPPPISGEDGRRAVVISEAAYASAESGQPVLL
jgi:UDP-N-acetylglucosamine 3-dehydrogenase